MRFNNWRVQVVVTAAVLLLVLVLPLIDRRICKRLGLNLTGGVSENPRGEQLLRVRSILLRILFGIYVAAFLYLVLLSRSATEEYQVHVAVFEDLSNSISMDLGILNVIWLMMTGNMKEAMSHVDIINIADIYQVYMNMMLFVPMGYLLPYVFNWFRARPWYRPVAGCFLISFVTENIQLIARRGFYDIDDLISNTLGGLLGQILFITVAYVVTHPHWRRELHRYYNWRRHARKRTLYPFIHKIGLSRTSLLGTDETAVWSFYVEKLGFRLKGQLLPENSEGTSFLFEMGRSQVEIICSNKKEELPPQYLTLSTSKLAQLRKRLEEKGIETEGLGQDPYTGLQQISFEGPDHVRITIIEK